ncbi:uroporphyrinogen-III synthase [uncultured Varibaculum sp.]|uniref:uroporphyrinogen-III synthase n=1 Tax=uncultured Varibaculum sp. TaxID=413896 RepID=UPI0028062712|nr:uroporphyrinogen-III synthase [uncultured Varibaculum sp.]
MMAFTVALTAAATRPLTKKLQAELPECRVVGAPVTRSRPVSPPQLPACLKRLKRGEYSWVIITSARTVTYLQQLLAAEPPLTTFPQVAAVGKASAQAASRAGWNVALQAGGNATDLARHFADLIADEPSPGRVFLPGSALSKPDLAAALSEQGYQVDICPLYTMAPVSACPEEYFRADAVAVTSGSNLRALADFGVFSSDFADPAHALPRLVCIGEPSAQVAKDLELSVAAVAKTPDAGGLAAALRSCLER